MRNNLVLGNWKMNGSQAFLRDILPVLSEELPDNVTVGVFPPFTYIALAGACLQGSQIEVGAQTVSEYQEGAYTGEVSTAMLKDLGCSYVLVGHSERREYYGETDSVVANKFKAATEAGLTPVLCVGETKNERTEGQTEAVVLRQLNAVHELMGDHAFDQAVIAYEPVWAIGTGDTATPEQAQAVHKMIRGWVAQIDSEIAGKIPLLYGGSMKADNAAALIAMSDIDGGLVGGASLDSQAFLSICRAVSAQ